MKKQVMCLVAFVALFCSSESLMATAKSSAVGGRKPNMVTSFMSNHPYGVTLVTAVMASVTAYNLNDGAKREIHEFKNKMVDRFTGAQRKVMAKMKALHCYCMKKMKRTAA